MDREPWKKIEGEVQFRAGTKPRWIEIEVRKPDGTVVKLIAREVSEFWGDQRTSL